MAVAAGAADIDRPRGRVDRDQPGAHRLCSGGDFDQRFAAVGQRDQEFADLPVARAAVEHRREGVRGLVDRTSAVYGTSVSLSVVLGGRLCTKKQKTIEIDNTTTQPT